MDLQPQSSESHADQLADLERLVGKFQIHEDGGSPAVWKNEETADSQRPIEKMGLWRWQTLLFSWMHLDPRYFTMGPFGSVAREMGRYFGKPITLWLPCATIGLTLLVLQWFVPNWDKAGGMPLGENEGYLRMGMILIGAFFIFLAWPNYRGKDWKPADDEEQFAAHERFAEMMRKHLDE